MRLPSFTKHSSKGTSSKDSVATGNTLPGTGTDDHATSMKPTTKPANESRSPFTITCTRCGTVLSVYITTKRIEEIQQAGNSELSKHQRRCEGPRRSPSQTGRSAAASTLSKDVPIASLWNEPRASSENATATFDANGAFLKRATAASDSRSSSSMPPTAVPSNKARAPEKNKTTGDHAGARATKRPTIADRSRPSFVAPSTSSGPSRSTWPSHSAGSSGTARPVKPARAPSYTDFYQREIEATKRAREEEEARAAAALAVHRGRKRGPEVPIEKDAGAMDEVMASIYNGKAKTKDEAERNVKKQSTA